MFSSYCRIPINSTLYTSTSVGTVLQFLRQRSRLIYGVSRMTRFFVINGERINLCVSPEGRQTDRKNSERPATIEAWARQNFGLWRGWGHKSPANSRIAGEGRPASSGRGLNFLLHVKIYITNCLTNIKLVFSTTKKDMRKDIFSTKFSPSLA